MKLIAVSLVLGFFIISCNQEEFDIYSFGENKGGVVTDSLALSANLIGSWSWEEELCYCCVNCLCNKSSWVTKADKYVIAVFRSNNTFSVSENGIIVIEGNWSVQKGTEGFVISLSNQESAYHYLAGSVNICDDQMLADSFEECKQLYIKNH